MPSVSKKQHLYWRWVLYGNPNATVREREVAKEFLDADKAKGQYQSETKVVVGGILMKGDKILVMDHVKIGKWIIPIGKVDKDEDHEAALVREMEEELGITVTEADYETSFGAEIGKKYIIFKVYRIKAYDGVPYNKEPDKHHSMRWMSAVMLRNFQRMKMLDTLVERLIEENLI